LDIQTAFEALCLLLDRAGSNNAAKMAIMAITTKSSINENAFFTF
jgi:hypothetical protein